MTIHRQVRRTRRCAVALAAVCLSAVGVASALAKSGTFLGSLHKKHKIASTVPGNGDVNPYGVAVAPVTMGKLVAGNVLVSNFNDKANKQGTGRTIVQMSPSGQTHLFASLNPSNLPGACPGGVGLTTALVALKSGWVVVGSLPAKGGKPSNMKAGCLIVINPSGKAVETISGSPINGPWDMTDVSSGSSATLFVSNVLNGTVKAKGKTVHGGTVVRVALSTPTTGVPMVSSETVIGKGLAEHTDPASLVIGPTGVGLSHGKLFVANSAASAIGVISNAMGRSAAMVPKMITKGKHLNDPLGLAIAPNGDVLTANGGDGKLIETTPAGQQVAVSVLDRTPMPPGPSGAGTLFGLALTPSHHGVYFVDDGNNTLNLLH